MQNNNIKKLTDNYFGSSEKPEDEITPARRLIDKANYNNPNSVMANADERSVNYLMSPMSTNGHATPDRGRRSLNARGETAAQEASRLAKASTNMADSQMPKSRFGIEYAVGMGRNKATTDAAEIRAGAMAREGDLNRLATSSENKKNIMADQALARIRLANSKKNGKGKKGKKDIEGWAVEYDKEGFPTARTMPDGTTQLFDGEGWGDAFGGPSIKQTPAGMFQTNNGTLTNQNPSGTATDITRNGNPARDKIVLPGQTMSKFNQKMVGLDALRIADGYGRPQVDTTGAQGNDGQAVPLKKTPVKKNKFSGVSAITGLDPVTALLMRVTNKTAKDYARVKTF